MTIKKLSVDDVIDFKTLIEIFKEVFEMEEHIANDEQLRKLLSNNDFFVFVATVNNTVVGGLTTYILHRYYNTTPVAYIYDLGIAPGFQGKGLGKALIAEVCNFCEKNNFESAYVAAELDDLEAVSFYRKTNYSSELNAMHFTYSFTKKH